MDWIHSYNKRSNENSIRGLEPTVSLYFLSLLEFPEELLVIKGLILRTLVSRACCPASGTGCWALPQAGGTLGWEHAAPTLPAVGSCCWARRIGQDGTQQGKESRGEQSCKVNFAFIKLSRDWKHAATSSWQRGWNTDVCCVWKLDFMVSKSPV